MYTLAPFFRYCSAILQRPSLKITTRCHSVFSLRSPVFLSRQVSDVATLRLAIGRPSWVRRISGSLPRFPTKITLFTLPAIATLRARIQCRLRPLSDPSGRPATCGGPYTLAGAATRLSLGFPHIASGRPLFQFCSVKARPDDGPPAFCGREARPHPEAGLREPEWLAKSSAASQKI